MAEKTVGKTRKSGVKARMESAPSPRGASAAMKQYIAGHLKAMYDEVAAEPIPERLIRLLDRLRN
jgi:hypothetical protein